MNEAQQYAKDGTEPLTAQTPSTPQKAPSMPQTTPPTAQTPLPTAQIPPLTAQTPLLTHEQFQRELSYRAAMSILRELRKNDLITSKEFVTIAPKLAERFSPVWGHLYQNIA